MTHIHIAVFIAITTFIALLTWPALPDFIECLSGVQVWFQSPAQELSVGDLILAGFVVSVFHHKTK